MKVRIVCSEDVDDRILSKTVEKLKEELLLLVEVSIATKPDPSADINHHIIKDKFYGNKNIIDTVLVPHIEALHKLNQLSEQLKNAEMAICMSKQTVQNLIAAGLPQNKLCFINPTHDSVVKPRPLIVGITSKTHADGRKNQNLLLQLSKNISPLEFAFKIMGSGWGGIVHAMKSDGFDVEYFQSFDYDLYIKLMPSLDYFLYYSFDEGSMGFIDALAAGVKTIVTPQGFHLDVTEGITHPINGTVDNLTEVLRKIIAERNTRIKSISSFTWNNFAKKHVELWHRLLKDKGL